MTPNTYAEKILGQLTALKKEDKPTEYRLRANYRKGIRCPECGRLFPFLQRLPSVRRCPNKECNQQYSIMKNNTGGILVTKIGEEAALRSLATSTLELSDIPREYIPNQMHWGKHILIDCSEANNNIDNPSLIAEFLQETIKRINMKPLSKPIVAYAEDEEGRGYSGIMLLASSHVSVHCDDTKRCIYADVFSCRPFEVPAVLACIKEYFEPKKMMHLIINRDAGDFPKSN